MSRYKLLLISFFLLFALPVACCAFDNNPENNLIAIRVDQKGWTFSEFLVVKQTDFGFKPFPESIKAQSKIETYASKSRIANEQQRDILEMGIPIVDSVMICLALAGFLIVPCSIGFLISSWYHKTKNVSDPGDVNPKVSLILLFIGIIFVAQPYLVGPNSVLHAPDDPLDPVETRSWYYNSSDKDMCYLWVDNGRSEPVIVYNRAGNQTSEIPAKSIVGLRVSPGILHMGLKAHDGSFIRDVNLHIDPALKNDIFIYNLDKNNRYLLETVGYVKHPY